MILGVLQARASSSRLPGKVLMPMAGAPMLERQIERLLRSRRMDKLVLATSDRSDDDPVAEIAARAGIELYRGSLDDVLDRYYQAARPHAPNHVVRVTGDCPLADWEVVDRVIGFAVDGDYDYASNTLNPTWPDGLDVEVVKFAALETAWREAERQLEREHVMPFLTSRGDRFRLGSLESETDLSHMRWTVDEPEDYAFVCRVYETLFPGNPAFTTADVLALLAEQPELVTLNTGFQRNEGLRKSEQAEIEEGKQ